MELLHRTCNRYCVFSMSHFCNKEMWRLVLISYDLFHSCPVLLVKAKSQSCFFQKVPDLLFFKLHLDLMTEYYRRYCDHYPHISRGRNLLNHSYLDSGIVHHYLPIPLLSQQTRDAVLHTSGVHGVIITPRTSAKLDVFWKYISDIVYILHFCSDQLQWQLKNLTYLVLNRPCKCSISELRNFPGKISLGKWNSLQQR